MTLGEIEGASKDNPSLRRMLQAIQGWMTAIEKNIGFDPQVVNKANRIVRPPPLASYVVTGQDGIYTIQITNPEGLAGQVTHEIRAATTVPVGKSLDIIIRGPSPDTLVTIVDPGTTRYFQLRSKYALSNYNQPQISEAVSSGP